MKDYLIYTSAGHAANVRQWCSSVKRNYDIWITNYTDTKSLHKEYADYYNERKGSKWHNLKAVFDEHRDLLAQYKAIMVADDDIIISPKALSALFRLSTENDIWILQPAFSRLGKISHKITQRKPATRLRYTNFIEVTCPIFRTDKLLSFLSVYRPELSLAFGVDWWYLHHLGKDEQQRYAISDKYYCINPRDRFKPGGRREIDRLYSHAERHAMWRDVKRELGINSYPYREFSKIDKNLVERIASYPTYAIEVLFGKVHSYYKGKKTG